MKTFLTTLLLFFIFFYSSIIIAQQEQVAFKPGVFEIDQRLRQELGILEKYKEDFQKARLLKDENNNYFIEVTYLKRGTIWTEKYALSPSELESIRNAIDGAANNLSSSASNNRVKNGRYGLIASATLHSIHQGIFISQLTTRETIKTNPWSGDPYTAIDRSKFGKIFPYIFSTATFATTLAITNNRQINPAAVNVHFWSSGIGLMHGGAILYILRRSNWGDTKLPSVLGATSLAEGWLMYYLAKRNNIDYARSMAWNTGNISGSLAGAYLSYIVLDNKAFQPKGTQVIGASVIAGGLGGVFLMDYLQKKYPRSSGDFRAVNSLGIASSVLGLGFIGNYKPVRAGSMYSFLCSSVGLTWGYLITGKTSFSQMEGALIGVGTAVGGLLGIGIATTEDYYDDAVSYTSWVGGMAMAGWLGTYLYFTQTGHRAAKKKSNKKMNYNFGLNPSGLVFMKSAPEQQYNMLRNSVSMDMVNLHVQF